MWIVIELVVSPKSSHTDAVNFPNDNVGLPSCWIFVGPVSKHRGQWADAMGPKSQMETEIDRDFEIMFWFLPKGILGNTILEQENLG